MPALDIRDITKTHQRGLPILSHLSLEVHDRERLVLFGASGCGKTTLLRILAGLDSADSGEVQLGGVRIDHLSPERRQIAMVLQQGALYPHLRVRENVAYALRLKGMKRDQIKRKVSEVAALLRFEELLDRKPVGLSGGQRQRVALARALVREPSLLLFDEPLAHLDAAAREEIRIELRRLHRRAPTTTILVTHDQAEAMTMGDRVAVLAQGRILQVAAPDQIYDQPASITVAQAIGSPQMNFIRGHLELIEELAHFVSGDLRVPVGRPSLPGDAVQRLPVTLGIRPEDIRPGDGEGRMIAKIDALAFLGDRTILDLKLGSIPLVMSSNSRHSETPGDGIPIALNADRIHLFAQASGERITLGT